MTCQEFKAFTASKDAQNCTSSEVMVVYGHSQTCKACRKWLKILADLAEMELPKEQRDKVREEAVAVVERVMDACDKDPELLP